MNYKHFLSDFGNDNSDFKENHSKHVILMFVEQSCHILPFEFLLHSVPFIALLVVTEERSRMVSEKLSFIFVLI